MVAVASELTALTNVCLVLDGLDDLAKTVGFRDLSARLSCIVGIGRNLWDRLHFDKQPLELRPFAPIKGAVRAAPSTPGDFLFHIRAERADLCFEFERILLESLGTGVTVVDEVSGFRYFDARDTTDACPINYHDAPFKPASGKLATPDGGRLFN